MKVLWFSVTPSLYGDNKNAHNGGGWIASLERIVSGIANINLGIAFISANNCSKKKNNNIIYYPLYIKRSFLGKIADKFTYKYFDDAVIESCLKVIADFHPDIIHIFGSEWCFGLLYQYTQVPIIIHMQGSWPAYRNAGFPPGFSRTDELLRRIFNPKALIGYLCGEHLSMEREKREEKILSHVCLYMGRTRWDCALTKLYAPNSRFYICNEALRSDFISSVEVWILKNRDKKNLVTVGGANYLKGYDVILKAAYLMKKWGNINFEWRLIGPSRESLHFFEKVLNIKCCDVNIIPLGRLEADDVKQNLLDSDIYVHASYIDNSPNSICEAQYLGVPIISTNVGGIISLFPPEYDSDLLVPTNDPYYMASAIIRVIQDKDKLIHLSELNRTIARKRHSDINIQNEITQIYESLNNKKEVNERKS